MKKKIVSYCLFLGIALILTQCKKESNVEVEQVPEEINIDEITSRFQSDYLQFKDSHKLKSGKIINLTDAIFEMDATFNSTYAKANHLCGQIQSEATNVTLTMVNETEVDYDNVLAAYGSAIDKVADAFDALNKTNKQLMMVTIEDDGSEGSNTRKLKITYVIGFATYMGDFGNDEKYLFSENATYNCDGDPAPGAPVIFETKLNEHFNSSTNTCRYYFYGNRSYANYYVDLDHPLEPTQDNYLDYKIFYADAGEQAFDPYDTECLEYNQQNSGIHEMQFHYNYYKEFATDWMNSISNTENKKYCPESNVVSWDHVVSGYRVIEHQLKYIFRKRGVMCNSAEPLR